LRTVLVEGGAVGRSSRNEGSSEEVQQELREQSKRAIEQLGRAAGMERAVRKNCRNEGRN